MVKLLPHTPASVLVVPEVMVDQPLLHPGGTVTGGPSGVPASRVLSTLAALSSLASVAPTSTVGPTSAVGPTSTTGPTSPCPLSAFGFTQVPSRHTSTPSHRGSQRAGSLGLSWGKSQPQPPAVVTRNMAAAIRGL